MLRTEFAHGSRQALAAGAGGFVDST